MNYEVMILLIRAVSQLFIWIVIVSSLLSYFVSPYHPVREALDRIVSPFLDPIRRVVPPAGMMDFSPLVLILLIDLVSRILIAIFISLS
jgi:YggT family protein